MGRPDVLASFIEEAADRFPAEQVRPHPLRPRRRQHRRLRRHRAARHPGLTVAGDARGDASPACRRPASTASTLINHAACLMANYETASALAPLAEYMAGSEEIMFGHHARAERVRQASARTSRARSGACQHRALRRDRRPATGGLGDLSAMSVVDGDACRASTPPWSRSPTPPSRTWPRSPPRSAAPGPAAGVRRRPARPERGGRRLRPRRPRRLPAPPPGVPDDVAVARDAVFAALDAGGRAPGDPPGHPAGHRPQRLLPETRAARGLRRRTTSRRRAGAVRRVLPAGFAAGERRRRRSASSPARRDGSCRAGPTAS